MAITDAEFAQKIYEYIGGKANILNATNCMTRIRITTKKPSIVNVDGLKKIPGVLSVLVQSDYFQIVVGPGRVKKVADQLDLIIASASGETKKEEKPVVEETPKVEEKPLTGNAFVKFFKRIGRAFKRVPWQRGFRHVGNIFSPLVPGFIAFGVLYGISCIILTCASGGNAEIMSEPIKYLTGPTKVFYCIFNYIAQGFIAYLAIMVGINAAKEFNVTPAVGGAIGGLSILPNILEISKAIPGWSWETVVGNQTITKGFIMAGNGGILAVILAILLIGYLERWIKKWMPDVLSTVFTPLLTLLIGGTAFLFVIMPIMGVAMYGVTNAVKAISSPELHWAIRAVIGFFLGALFLPLVMLGLHRGLDAIYMDFIAKNKYTPLYPVFAMADASQAGAGLAIFLKAKKYKHTLVAKNAISGVVPQVLGVSEPLIYGVTLPMVKPFVSVGIGAGIAGAVVNAVGLQCSGFAVSGLMAIPIMNYMNGELKAVAGMLTYVACWLLAVICGFFATLLLVNEKDINRIPREE